MSSNAWTTERLETLCRKIGSGATPRGGKESYLDKGPFSLIQSQNVLDFYFSYDGLAFIDEKQAQQLNNVEVQERDVLLNITGDSVARVCQVPSDLLPARVNQHVSIIRPDSTKLNPEFLKYFLLKPGFKNYMLGLASVGGTRNALTKGMIEEFEIEFPPLEAQKRIASVLSSLDEKIELNRQTNATLEAIAQAIFKEWFVDFRFPGATGVMQDSEFGPIPKGWRVGRLRDICEINPSLSLRKGSIAKYVEMKNLSNCSLAVDEPRDREFSSGSKFQNGDTLLARITPCLENGKTGFVDFLKKDEIGWGSTEFIVLRANAVVNPFYIYCLSRLSSFRDFAIQSMVGSSGRQRVVESILADFPIIIPEHMTQEKFSEIMESVFLQVKNNSDQCNFLSQIRSNLLPKLMSGEIEV